MKRNDRTRQMAGRWLHTLVAVPCCLLAAGLMGACSSIDCPLNNTVRLQVSMGGEAISDTLTILTQRYDGTDTVLFNKGVKTSAVSLPMSYNLPQDVLVFNITDTNKTTTSDTIYLSKTNQAHFESVDCGQTFFHTLTAVSCTHHAIDSVIINDPNVDYDATKQHLYIYYRSHR